MNEPITSDELIERLRTIIDIPDYYYITDMEITLTNGSYAVIDLRRYACDKDDPKITTWTEAGEIIDEKLYLVTKEQYAKFQTLQADLIIANKKLENK